MRPNPRLIAGVLPPTPQRYKKVLFYAIESEQGVAYSVRKDVARMFRERLEAEGFDIDAFDPGKAMEGMMTPYASVTDKYDLIVYLANMSAKSNQTTVRIEWAQPMGANAPVYISSAPTVFIPVENPYHLLDVPRDKTFVNAYASFVGECGRPTRDGDQLPNAVPLQHQTRHPSERKAGPSPAFQPTPGELNSSPERNLARTSCLNIRIVL